MIISRIAPTPSGFLHRGNAYNFLLTEAITAGAGRRLRLRIDDLDAPRIRSEYLDDIFETLNWLGIEWQEGPQNATIHEHTFKQEYRLERYTDLLEQLAKSGNVYACTCSRKEIAAQSINGHYPGTCRLKKISLSTPDLAWRLHVDANAVVGFEDALLGSTAINLYNESGDFVVRRRDGLPAYHIATLADDVDFGINTIVRGADLLLSTAMQLHLAALLYQPSFTDTRFYHHPLIKDDLDQKLSKSAGGTSVKQLRASGMTAATFREEFEQWHRSIAPGKSS